MKKKLVYSIVIGRKGAHKELFATFFCGIILKIIVVSENAVC